MKYYTRRLIVDDVEYASIAEAAQATGIDRYTLRNRAVSRNPQWDHIRFAEPTRHRKVVRTKAVQVCFRGTLYPSVDVAAQANGLTSPTIAHYLNSHHHPDSYYLLKDGTQFKQPELCRWRASKQTRARAARRRQQLRPTNTPTNQEHTP